MIKFTIVSPAVRENKGIGAKSGKPYHMHLQTAYAHTFDKQGVQNPFPEKVELVLDLDEHSNLPKVYEPGEYTMHPASLYMGQYGLEVAPKLVPLKKSQ
jgi:hypothetical protein